MGLVACLPRATFVALLLACVAAHATTREECERRFAPRMGQSGKDVIWIPTPDVLARAMLNAAGTTAADYVIDLGAGDGKIPIAAAKEFGAAALGVEYNPQLVKLARCNVQAEGLTDKVEIRQADIFATDFSAATVLTLYLLSDLNMRLRSTILKMKPGTRVVSNTFKMGDWSPDQFIESELGNTRAYLWVVPAQVAGTWRFREQGGADGFRVSLTQHFQEIKGSLLGAASASSLRDARLRGAEIEFTLVGNGAGSLKVKGAIAHDQIDAVAERDGRTVHYIGRPE
jgi:Methyltransferase domain